MAQNIAEFLNQAEEWEIAHIQSEIRSELYLRLKPVANARRVSKAFQEGGAPKYIEDLENLRNYLANGTKRFCSVVDLYSYHAFVTKLHSKGKISDEDFSKFEKPT